MFFSSNLDFTLPNFVLICGLPIVIVLFILVCVIEALILRRLIPEARVFRDSFLMNAVTTLLGWIPFLLPDMAAAGLPNILPWIPLGWLISIIVEGFVLKMLERSYPVLKIFTTSLVVNSASYLLLVIVTLFLPAWAFKNNSTPFDQLMSVIHPTPTPEYICDNVYSTLVENARGDYVKGNYENAIALYTMALYENPVKNYWLYMLRADAYVGMHDIPSAISDLETAGEGCPGVVAVTNKLCWYLGVMGQAEQALPYCEQAIQDIDLGLEINSYWQIRPGAILDSRALVYAQLGRFQEAARDFQVYVDEMQGSEDEGIPEKRQQRMAWVAALNAGQNPFTPEVLAELRGESDDPQQ